MVFMIVISLYYGISSGGVDNWGHIGGLIMGFLLCMILYRKPRKAVDFTGENPYTYSDRQGLGGGETKDED
jgi:rhomboid protease GluP